MGPLHLKHLLHFPFLSCLPQLLLSLVEKLAHKSTVKYKNRLSFQILLDNQVSIQQDATCLFSCQSDIETWNGKVSYAPNLTCNKGETAWVGWILDTCHSFNTRKSAFHNCSNLCVTYQSTNMLGVFATQVHLRVNGYRNRVEKWYPEFAKRKEKKGMLRSTAVWFYSAYALYTVRFG